MLSDITARQFLGTSGESGSKSTGRNGSEDTNNRDTQAHIQASGYTHIHTEIPMTFSDHSPRPPNVTSVTNAPAADAAASFSTVTFESLPNDLILYLLEHYIHTPTDLANLLRASPIYFSVFRAYRYIILANVLRWAYLPELLPLALRVCTARREVSGNVERVKDLESARTRQQESITEDWERRIGQATGENQRLLRHGIDHLKQVWEDTEMKNEVNIEISQRLLLHGQECLKPMRKNMRTIDRRHAEEIGKLQQSGLEYFKSLKATRVQLFLDQYSDESKKEVDLYDEALVKRVFKLWRIVDFFINDFFRYTRTQQNRYIRLFEPGENISEGRCCRVPQILSKIEYSRIQRAFLHFELFRQLYGGPSGYEFTQARVGRSACHEFANSITDYELHELASVNEYLNSHFERILDEIGAFAKKFTTAVSRHHNDCIVQNPNVSKCFPRDSVLRWYQLDIGLPFLSCFMQKDIVRQTVIAGKYNIKHFPTLFVRFLRFRPLRPLPKITINKDDIFSPSQGFLELYSQARSQQKSKAEYGLRQCGYLFWDKVHPKTDRCDALFLKDQSLNRSPLNVCAHADVKVASNVLRVRLPNLEDKTQIDEMFSECEY